MGLALMIGFIGPVDTVRDYTLQFTNTYASVHSHDLVTASRGERSPSSGFRNSPLTLLPASYNG